MGDNDPLVSQQVSILETLHVVLLLRERIHYKLDDTDNTHRDKEPGLGHDRETMSFDMLE